MTNVSDIMNPRVITVDPKSTLSAAVDLFTENHVGGAPVVDGRGRVVGMISELQLMDVVFDPESRDAPVSAYMTTDIQAVEPTDTLTRVAQLFALHSFRRLPVIDRGTLVGIITRRDLMNYALRTGERLTEPLVEYFPELAQFT
jgi:CBS domain-containing protein